MYGVCADNIKDIEFVLDNLCQETRFELVKIFGCDYKFVVIERILASGEKYTIKLKTNDEPVGLFGLVDEGEGAGGIFLLTTENLYQGSVITFLKSAKRQIKEWRQKYELIMDLCHKENKKIQKWLTLLEFKKSAYQNEDFCIWYLGDIGRYLDY